MDKERLRALRDKTSQGRQVQSKIDAHKEKVEKRKKNTWEK